MPKGFFSDEVRDGFYISEMMKRFWGAQMVVLGEIEKICERHSIKYFADMGTLLGAVRHKGFIPWDDDLDISMLRDDWERFFEYAKDELPEGYIVFSAESNQEYGLALGRIVNGGTINTEKAHLEKFCGCPYVAGVDVFPLDKLYNDSKKEADRKVKIYEIYRLSTLIRNKGFDDPETREFMIRVQEHNGVAMGEDNARDTLLTLSEQISAECRDEDAKEVAFMVPWALWDRMNMPIQYFDQIIDLPFENGTIKAPAAYDEVLKKEYGDYMVVRRGMGAHEYPVYQDQEETLREHLGRNPYRFTFPKESFSEERQEPSYGALYQKLKDLGAEDSFTRLFPASYLERKAEGKKDVLFLPCKAEWWNTMASVYDNAVSDPIVTVSVIPIPYFDCDYLGNVGEGHDESSLITEKLGSDKITDFERYALEQRHPDAIVIQVPYDAWSGIMTVPEILYSNNLLKYTDNLIYVPCFDVGDPISEEDVVNAAMKVLIEQPAVVNSDTVLVGTEVMKKLYVDTLTGLSGDEHREYWEKKIKLQSELAW